MDLGGKGKAARQIFFADGLNRVVQVEDDNLRRCLLEACENAGRATSTAISNNAAVSPICGRAVSWNLLSS